MLLEHRGRHRAQPQLPGNWMPMESMSGEHTPISTLPRSNMEVDGMASWKAIFVRVQSLEGFPFPCEFQRTFGALVGEDLWSKGSNRRLVQSGQSPKVNGSSLQESMFLCVISFCFLN